MHEEVFYERINDKNVFCCLAEPTSSQGSKKLVVMSHGFVSSSIGPGRSFVDLARLLIDEGFSSLRFDQFGSGNSEGDYLETSFNEWVAAIAYLAKKYLERGYELALLGQSMGASATVVATNHPDLKGKIACIILWVPDPESDFAGDPHAIYEEGGQQHRGSFWQEAKDANFFGCLEKYTGGIHLVYGEHDRYVSQELRDQTIQIVQQKGQQVTILKGEDHSTWAYGTAHAVYRENIAKLKQHSK